MRSVANSAQWVRVGHGPQIVRYPDRYVDERGAAMWERVMTLIDRQQLNMAV